MKQLWTLLHTQKHLETTKKKQRVWTNVFGWGGVSTCLCVSVEFIRHLASLSPSSLLPFVPTPTNTLADLNNELSCLSYTLGPPFMPHPFMSSSKFISCALGSSALHVSSSLHTHTNWRTVKCVHTSHSIRMEIGSLCWEMRLQLRIITVEDSLLPALFSKNCSYWLDWLTPGLPAALFVSGAKEIIMNNEDIIYRLRSFDSRADSLGLPQMPPLLRWLETISCSFPALWCEKRQNTNLLMCAFDHYCPHLKDKGGRQLLLMTLCVCVCVCVEGG